MGKYSNPRKNHDPQTDYGLDLDMDLDTDLDMEFDLNLDEQEGQFAGLADSPLYANPENAYVPQPVPRRKRSVLIITLCSIVALLLAGIIGGVLFIMSGGLDDGLILPNVYVAGVNVGGMTPEQATAKLQQTTAMTYTETDMEVKLPDTTLTFSPKDTGAALNVTAAVEAAYNYGRDGSWSENRAIRERAESTSFTIPVLSCLNLNLDYIRETLDGYCTGFNSEFRQSSATVEGEMPLLDTSDENFDPEAPCQVLILDMGTPGRYVDPEKLYNQVLEAYSSNVFSITFTMDEAEVTPDALNMKVLEIYETYYHEPFDAIMDKQTFEVSHETYGYGFDLEAVLSQMEESSYGDILKIDFQYLIPEHTKENLEAMLFRDVLASYETKHTNNANRNVNLTLACAAINGFILDPGEEFDYNTVVGKRTAEAGYKAADAYDGGMTVKTLGGGICQVSSTLYYCTLIADLEIINRTPHSYVSSYMPLGMDATVSWGGPEFTFKNNTNYPIRIEAEVSDGYVRIRLIGTDEKDYYVEMEYEVLGYTYADTVYEEYPPNNEKGYKDGEVIATPYNGCTVKTYKLKYSKETGELISREEDQISRYKKRDKIIVKIVDPSTATEAPTEAPVQPEGEAG